MDGCPRARWKKLENVLLFINKSKQCAKLSKSTQTTIKRSKWVLMKNVFRAVNYFIKLSLSNLQLERMAHFSSPGRRCIHDKSNHRNVNEIVVTAHDKHNFHYNMERKSKNKLWVKLRNTLHCIRYREITKIKSFHIINIPEF